MHSFLRTVTRRSGWLACVAVYVLAVPHAEAQIDALTVDCTPFVSPGATSFGPSNTMGMALQSADTGGLFNVTEVTPAAFRAMSAAQLAAFDLIAINNNPSRIDCGSGLGLGTTWHNVIGVNDGGRVHLNSHDAPRFKMIVPPFSTPFSVVGLDVEPFGAIDLVRQAALWAGGGTRTGLLIFNDSVGFVGGVGWDNPQLNLPAAWGISNSDQFFIPTGNFVDGGYTDILPPFETHPIYAGLSDARFGVNSISSFAANIVDDPFHSVFASFNASVLTPTEVIVNAGVVDVGGFNATFGFGTNVPAPGPDGLAISLIRDELESPRVDRVDNATKGSALIYSKVDLRWGPDGRLLQDTILEITNDFPDDVYVQFYFINGDEPRDAIFALDPPVLVSEGEPGWNWVDCQTLLTANQPKYWSASSGSPLGCQPFTILDPDGGNGAGRLDPASQDGGRVLRGYVLAWAVDEHGHPVRWNHLSGAATIVNYGAQTAWEYNAWAAQRNQEPQPCAAIVGPGRLQLDGLTYDAGFDVLLMDFYASGSTALSGGGLMASSDTDLTLHPISADLRQDSRGPITTKAHFDIWNGNEQRFSGTRRCITCWDQTLLSRYDAPNHFLLGFLGTDRGKARIDGQRSDVCDDDCVRANLDETGTDWGVCSYDASLIGVVAKILEFSGPVTGHRAMSGRSIVGAGRQSAEILYDIIAPPGELRDDAYETMGGLHNDVPERIDIRKALRGRGASPK